MSGITKADLRIDHHTYGIDVMDNSVDIRVDIPPGEAGKYFYIADVEKIANGLHVHWKKISSSIDQNPLSNMTITANKAALYVGGFGLLCIVLGTISLFTPDRTKKPFLQKMESASAVLYILAGLAMVLYARNRWAA